MEDKSSVYDRLSLVMERIICMFYGDEGLIRSWDLGWLQAAPNDLIDLFHILGLMVSVAKFKTMTLHPGEIYTGMSEEALNLRSTGGVATYQEHLWRHIPCLHCGVYLTS